MPVVHHCIGYRILAHQAADFATQAAQFVGVGAAEARLDLAVVAGAEHQLLELGFDLRVLLGHVLFELIDQRFDAFQVVGAYQQLGVVGVLLLR